VASCVNNLLEKDAGDDADKIEATGFSKRADKVCSYHCSKNFRPNKHKHKRKVVIPKFQRGRAKSMPSDLSKRASITRRQLKYQYKCTTKCTAEALPRQQLKRLRC
jgi:hypothetical protein